MTFDIYIGTKIATSDGFFRSFIYPENGPSSGEDFHGLQPCTVVFLTYICNGYNKFGKTLEKKINKANKTNNNNSNSKFNKTFREKSS